MHRLELELTELFKNDPKIYSFVEDVCLDGVWYWDLEHPEEQYISQKFWTMLGYNPKGKVHSPKEWRGIINDDDLRNAIDNFHTHCKNPNQPYEQLVRFLHKDGNIVWINCKAIVIRDEQGKAIRMLGANKNVTALKNAEINALKTLEARDRFFARMSHEIRTPLHGIIGIAEILEEKNKDSDLAQYIKTISNCGSQLKMLLEDLLTISSINEDKLNVSIEEVKLDQVIAYIADLFRSKAMEKGVEFVIDVPNDLSRLHIMTDKIRFNQILCNLVENAIKFTFEGSVTLSVIDNGERIEIAVSDTGVGIDDVEELLHTVENKAQNKNEITGLGIEIVSKLCKKLTHNFTLTSAPGQGTWASITCLTSQNKSAEEPDLNFVEQSKNASLGNVLVVDDNAVNVEIASLMLSDHTRRLDTATNGAEAVELVQRYHDYDLILMDLNMPIMDGFEASSRILADRSNKKKPRIFAVTADAFEDTIRKCMSLGMSGHICKPFSQEKLIKMIDSKGDAYVRLD